MAVEVDFDVLFRSQYPHLVALGVAMAGNVEVAHDLAQETMARAHRHWDTVSIADSPEAWLRRVMTNLLIDAHRRRRVETAALERLSVRPSDDAGPAPGSGFADLLDVLSDRQRVVVSLYYLDDLPIAAIAETLDIAEGTVKAMLWKARRTLARHVSREAR